MLKSGSSLKRACASARACSKILIAKSGQPQVGQAALASAKELTGASQLQVLLGQGKAILGGLYGSQPLLGLRRWGVGEEQTIGLILAPTNPAAELVQLGQAETVIHIHAKG